MQPNHNLRVMGSPEKSGVIDVDAGQSLELEYASMETSHPGKLSALSCQESSLFTLTFGMLCLFYFKGIFGIVEVGLFFIKYEKDILLQITLVANFSKGLKQIVDKLFSSSKLRKLNLINLRITIENKVISVPLNNTMCSIFQKGWEFSEERK